MLQASILLIGDELLNGTKTDTNSVFIGKHWTEMGGHIVRKITVGDGSESILQGLHTAAQGVSFVFISGGLGPTPDDITAQTLGTYFNIKEKTEHLPTLARLTAWAKEKNQPLSPRQRAQCLVYKEATHIFENTTGTAPATIYTKDNVVFISMPGVPMELQTIFTEQVLPYIKTHYLTPTLLTAPPLWLIADGITEADLADRLTDWESALPSSIRLAYLPEGGLIYLRLSTDNAQTYDALHNAYEQLNIILKNHIVARENIHFLDWVRTYLTTKNLSIATAESCTGGYLAYQLTQKEGASAYYKGSIIAYQNEVKIKNLGVSLLSASALSNAVSEEVARAMLQGVLARTGADLGIATTGMLNIDKKDTPREAYICIGNAKHYVCHHLRFKSNHRASNLAYIAYRVWYYLYQFLQTSA